MLVRSRAWIGKGDINITPSSVAVCDIGAGDPVSLTSPLRSMMGADGCRRYRATFDETRKRFSQQGELVASCLQCITTAQIEHDLDLSRYTKICLCPPGCRNDWSGIRQTIFESANRRGTFAFDRASTRQGNIQVIGCSRAQRTIQRHLDISVRNLVAGDV